MRLRSKLPEGGVTIFSKMSNLAQKHEAINLGQGFPNFDCDKELRDRICYHLHDGKNQYCPMPGLYELRETLAKKINKLYNREIDPNSEITITAGATQAIFTAITAFVHEGDEVIILEPAYDCYKPTIELVNGKCIPHRLSGPDYEVNWEEVKKKITVKTSMIVINTPHNPIGKTLKAKDLVELEKIVSDRDIVVLSDEVYEHLIYDNADHQSVLRFANLYKKSMAIFSFGKTFHSTGWKVGYAVGPEALTSEFRKIHQWNVFCVNSFVQYGLNDYLQDESQYLKLPSFYQEKRDYLNNLLKDSKLKAIPSEGTYFQLFDYSDISDENDIHFTENLVTEYGVASIPVSVFSTEPSDDRMIRLCFAKTNHVLEQAAERLNKI